MYYKLNMKLSNEQIDQIKKACEDVEFGSVTIKMNATSNFVDLVVEKQIRIKNNIPTKPPFHAVDKQFVNYD